MLNVALAALLIVPPLAAIELRRAEKSEVDREIRKGISSLKTRPRIRGKVVATRKFPVQDNSGGSYGALGIRASGWPLPGTPAWLWNPDIWFLSLSRHLCLDPQVQTRNEQELSTNLCRQESLASGGVPGSALSDS